MTEQAERDRKTRRDAEMREGFLKILSWDSHRHRRFDQWAPGMPAWTLPVMIDALSIASERSGCGNCPARTCSRNPASSGIGISRPTW